MDDNVVEAMTDKILGKLPNTYAFTKALAEGLVEESMPHIPSIILRYRECLNMHTYLTQLFYFYFSQFPLLLEYSYN